MKIKFSATVQAGDECTPLDHGIDVPGEVYIRVLSMVDALHSDLRNLIESTRASSGDRFIQATVDKDPMGLRFEIRMNDEQDEPF